VRACTYHMLWRAQKRQVVRLWSSILQRLSSNGSVMVQERTTRGPNQGIALLNRMPPWLPSWAKIACANQVPHKSHKDSPGPDSLQVITLE
jgi:hypothetical protein